MIEEEAVTYEELSELFDHTRGCLEEMKEELDEAREEHAKTRLELSDAIYQEAECARERDEARADVLYAVGHWQRCVKERDKALEVAARFGQVDGEHHKAWVIDQMVRALTGCPKSEQSAWTCISVGESEEYREWVRAVCDGEDGPDTYEWDAGIAP